MRLCSLAMARRKGYLPNSNGSLVKSFLDGIGVLGAGSHLAFFNKRAAGRVHGCMLDPRHKWAALGVATGRFDKQRGSELHHTRVSSPASMLQLSHRSSACNGA